MKYKNHDFSGLREFVFSLPAAWEKNRDSSGFILYFLKEML